MITWKKGRLASIALIAPVVLGASAAAQLELQPQSKLWVSGTSTVRSWECAASGIQVTVNTSGSGAVAAILDGQKAVTNAAVKVASAKLDCKNGQMNEHMLKALKADQHPEIAFKIDSYELVPGSGGMKAKLNGALTLGGTTKNIVVESDAQAGGEGVLRVTGQHTVKMSDYGLKRPSLMLGTLKVGDDVQVHFDLYLKS